MNNFSNVWKCVSSCRSRAGFSKEKKRKESQMRSRVKQKARGKVLMSFVNGWQNHRLISVWESGGKEGEGVSKHYILGRNRLDWVHTSDGVDFVSNNGEIPNDRPRPSLVTPKERRNDRAFRFSLHGERRHSPDPTSLSYGQQTDRNGHEIQWDE